MEKTALYQFHQRLGAKIVPFAGYEMPLFYDLGMLKEHVWVREFAGVFDVSHMGQLLLKNSNAAKMLSILTPSDFSSLPDSKAKYSVLLNENAGIIDDIIATRLKNDLFFVVVNAARKENDIAWFRKWALEFECEIEILDRSLIAIQGQKSEAILSKILQLNLADQNYMSLQEAMYQGEKIFISRTGYTGEDGFEVSISNHLAIPLCEELISYEAVKAIGLGARDSLRLEMGYPLYGHDLSEELNLSEVNLNWIISSKEEFIGKINLNSTISKKRIGLRLIDKGIAREGMTIHNLEEEQIGVLTSAGFSPILDTSIGQGYVEIASSKLDTEVLVKIRDKFKKAVITKLSVLPAKTKK